MDMTIGRNGLAAASRQFDTAAFEIARAATQRPVQSSAGLSPQELAWPLAPTMSSSLAVAASAAGKVPPASGSKPGAVAAAAAPKTPASSESTSR